MTSFQVLPLQPCLDITKSCGSKFFPDDFLLSEKKKMLQEAVAGRCSVKYFMI